MNQFWEIIEQHIANAPTKNHTKGGIEDQVTDLFGGPIQFIVFRAPMANNQAPIKPNKYINPYQCTLMGPGKKRLD